MVTTPVSEALLGGWGIIRLRQIVTVSDIQISPNQVSILPGQRRSDRLYQSDSLDSAESLLTALLGVLR
ncbi:hypothetical protein B9S53_12730 [Arthrospira sp. O9.13F]|nr:hypothetical protein B9S53_12730 [Arthrospira sp. O9.13F]